MNKTATPQRYPLLIIWHSRTGASEQLATAAWQGAFTAESRAPALLRRCNEVQQQDMLGAGSYLFVCPENLGSISGLMKEFFDRCYYPLLDQINGRAYASIICAGSDGQGAARQIARIATGWRLRDIRDATIIGTQAVSQEQILAAKQVPDIHLEMARDLGAAMASAVVLGVY